MKNTFPTAILSRLGSSVALSLGLTLPAGAALFTFSGPFADAGAGPGIIAGGNPIALVDVQNLSGQGLASSITGVILTVHLGSADGVSSLLGQLRLGDQAGSPSVSFNPTSTSYTVDLATTFSSYNPNDNWTLSFANPTPGFDNTLVSWSLEITAVPEPTNLALGVFGLLLVGAGFMRWCSTGARPFSWPGGNSSLQSPTGDPGCTGPAPARAA